MHKDTIIFDCFGVICSEIVPFWLNEYFEKEEITRIKKDVISLADSGQITQDELFHQLGKLAGVSAKSAEAGWWKYVNINTSVLNLINDLKKLDYSIVLLSNSPSPFIRDVFKKYNLYEYFESIFISSEMGCAKPDVAIYHKLLSDVKKTSDQVLFIDDNHENVQSSKSVGIESIVFESFNQLKQELIEKNIYKK